MTQVATYNPATGAITGVYTAHSTPQEESDLLTTIEAAYPSSYVVTTATPIAPGQAAQWRVTNGQLQQVTS